MIGAVPTQPPTYAVPVPQPKWQLSDIQAPDHLFMLVNGTPALVPARPSVCPAPEC